MKNFWRNRKNTFRTNLKSLYPFLIFMVAMIIADIITTEIALLAGFTEKSPGAKVLMEISPLLANITLVLVILSITIVLISIKKEIAKLALHTVALFYFFVVIGNINGLYQYLSGRLVPY